MEVSDQAIVQSIGRFAGVRGRGTLPNVVAFSRVLKSLGVPVSPNQVIDASRSLGWIDVTRRHDFHTALRSNLIIHREDLSVFDRAFSFFWHEGEPGDAESEVPPGPEPGFEGILPQGGETGEDQEEARGQITDVEEEFHGQDEAAPYPMYSPMETLRKKDFSEMGVEESRTVRRLLLLIAARIATQVGRRKQKSRRGEGVDLRGSMRRSLKYGGEVMELLRRKRRIQKTRIILLCDVSGSMDCYSRFLIQFMYGLQNELWGVETFVFSTRLSRITHILRRGDIDRALEGISDHVLGWSGGTNIGSSLRAFNRDFAPSLVTRRTVIVVISDGWDRGDAGVLEREMSELKRRCCKIIWLNPLLASENYEPLCKGMQAALPHLDYFMSVHSVDSLLGLGRTLQRLEN